MNIKLERISLLDDLEYDEYDGVIGLRVVGGTVTLFANWDKNRDYTCKYSEIITYFKEQVIKNNEKNRDGSYILYIPKKGRDYEKLYFRQVNNIVNTF